MPTAYTSLLGLALPVTGELQGTWGTTVNDAITSLLDTAVAGTTTLSTDADVTLTTTTGASNQARQAIILWTANGSVTRNITAPAQSKTYVVINASAGTQSIVIRGAGPTTGVTVLKGERVTVAWNGSDFVKVGGFGGSGTFNDVTITTGNLSFSGTAQRITGDMSNATVANRLAFQTSTVNGDTLLGAFPNGTGTSSRLLFFNQSDISSGNYSTCQIGLLSTEATIRTGTVGSGTALPLTFFTNGSERMRIDTSGNVAVGTTSAGTAGLSLSQTYNLSWEQSATESISNLFRQTSSAALVMSVGYKRSATANGFASSFGSSLAKTAISLGTTAGAITFYTDAAATAAVGTDVTPTERMRITSSGNVGIGTASPTTRLTVSSATNAGLAVTDGTVNTIVYNSTGGVASIGTTSNHAVQLYSNNSARVTIDTSGNVGIGTASPGAKLDVKGLVATDTGFSGTFATTGTNIYGLSLNNSTQTGKFQITGPTYNFSGVGANEAWLYSESTNLNIGPYGAYVTKFINNGLERMRIDTSGNVGIGTASPSQYGRTVSSAGASQVGFMAVSSGTAGYPAFGFDGQVTANGGRGAGMYLPADNTLAWSTTGSERMRIDSSGNVGIGTASPAAKLNVSAASGYLEMRVTSGSNNAYLGADGSNAYVGTYQAIPLQFGTNSTERMRIDSSGNVGIGTASPSVRLDVTGNSNITNANVRVRFLNTAGTASTLLFGADSGSVFLGAETNAPIYFITNNAERMRITAAGNIVAGASAALATTATDGFLYVPTCAGTPTGTPTAITGMAPIVVNTTNNKLYFYSGGAWRDAGP